MARPNDADSSYFQYRGGDGDKTSLSFIVRLQVRDPEAWKDFKDLYVPLIRYWCRRMKNQLTRAERQDILQDVQLKVSMVIDRFDAAREGRSFRGWLRSITKHRIYDYLQERAKQVDVSRLDSAPAFPTPVMPEPDDEIDPEEEQGEQLVLIKQILNRIRPTFREKSWDVFHLLLVAEKDSSEVAETMGMKVDAVRQLRSRILKRIREEYAKLGIETD